MKSVVVLEENDGLRAVVAEALGREGFDVLEAATPEIALELLRCHRAPVGLLADPACAGHEPTALLRALAALCRERGLRFLVATDQAALEALGRSVGSAGTLRKPFDLDRLLALARFFGA